MNFALDSYSQLGSISTPHEYEVGIPTGRKGNWMTNNLLMKTVAVASAAVALGFASSAPALAAPTGETSAQATINDLEAQGLRVILNKVGNAPIDQCTVTAVRQGSDVKHSWVQRGPSGNVNNLVRYTTTYVDLMCNR